MTANDRKSPEFPLSLADGGFREIQENLNESRRLDRERLDSEIARSGGPLVFLRTRFPLLATTAPDALSDESMSRTTLVDLSDAERRLQGCAMCPPEGGICATDHAGHKPGTQPSFQTGRMVFSDCSRWPEYRIRTRIMTGGVPKRYAGIAIGALWDKLSEDTQSALKTFSKAFRAGEFSTLVVGGAQSTLVCVAMLRSLVMNNESISFRFMRTPELSRDLKTYFATQGSKDPLDDTSEVTILVLCDVNLEYAQQWFRDAVVELTQSRFLQEKVTIVGVAGGNLEQQAALEQLSQVAQELGYDDSVPVCLAE